MVTVNISGQHVCMRGSSDFGSCTQHAAAELYSASAQAMLQWDDMLQVGHHALYILGSHKAFSITHVSPMHTDLKAMMPSTAS